MDSAFFWIAVQCPPAAAKGHFVALTMNIETTADPSQDINQFVWFGAQSGSS
jgi:hypothetical protein